MRPKFQIRRNAASAWLLSNVGAILIALTAEPFIAAPARLAPVYPRAHWDKAVPEALGWSSVGLSNARTYFETLPAASLVLIEHGREVVEWGDAGRRIKSARCAKAS